MTSADLRLGRWQDVLTDVECDAMITDPPYGRRTHEGTTARRERTDSAPGGGRPDGCEWRELGYGHWSDADVHGFVSAWARAVRGWWACMTSHDLVPAWQDAYEQAGLYAFAPLPVVDHGSRVRLCGDGPSSWTVWLMVARPKTAAFSRWGTLPGAYERSPGDERSGRMGGKPLGVMRAIIRDYSRPGDLVCDPFAGHATTLLAALTEGRRAVGSEADPEAHAAASRRLAAGYTPSLFGGAA